MLLRKDGVDSDLWLWDFCKQTCFRKAQWRTGVSVFTFTLIVGRVVENVNRLAALESDRVNDGGKLWTVSKIVKVVEWLNDK